MRWPTYAAYILIKYYISKTNSNETYVTVNYAGEVSEAKRLNDIQLFLFQPQILPNCDSYYCPYSTFIKNLENRFEKPKFVSKD